MFGFYRSSKLLKYLLYLSAFILIFLLAACGESGDGARNGSQTGTFIIQLETIPEGQPGTIAFSGVGEGGTTTIEMDETLEVDNLDPGTYTITEFDPAPEFDLIQAYCDDDDSDMPSAGDAQTRTVVINLEAGETVTCTFVNAQRGAFEIVPVIEPEGFEGTFGYSGVGDEDGTAMIESTETILAEDLSLGTYTITEFDPGPEFDLIAISCDDEDSATPSTGDAQTRTAVINIDPGETVTCTYVNSRRGSFTIVSVTDPEGVDREIGFSGYGEGGATTISSTGSFTAENLSQGTYTIAEFDPAPVFELTEISCDDDDSLRPSFGDVSTRTVVINIDPGESVTCTFVNAFDSSLGGSSGSTSPGGITSGGNGNGNQNGNGSQINPFTDPETYLLEFPLPQEIPPDAGTYPMPLEGPWTAYNLAGNLSCGGIYLDISASPPEGGTLTILDDGVSVLAESFDVSEGAPITMTADPEIIGLFSGVFDGTQDGVPIVIDYFWQVVTPDYIVGYLTSTFESEGVACSIYRPFTLEYTE